MRAAVFKGPSQPLIIEAVPDPTPGANDLILKVKNCGVCGTDLHLTEPGSAIPLPPGSILGHELSGEVVEVGSAVKTPWKSGDRVAGFPMVCCGDHSPCLNFSQRGACGRLRTVGLGSAAGAYAEYVRIDADGAHRLPDSVSFREGALVEPLAVGLHAVEMARMRRGATVLILGAGPVGLATMLWAKFLGARHVIVSEPTGNRRRMAEKFGATDVVDSSRALAPQVQKLAGRAPDVIFECVGLPGLLGAAMREAPPGGRIVVAGVCQQPDTIPPLVGIAKELEIKFVLGYKNDDFDYVIAMLEQDRIDVAHMITDIVDLDGLPGAFEALRQPSQQCKLMLEN